jgi:ubiquinone biosynthesis protein UbiJ
VLSSLTLPAVNHVLRSHPWALDKLRLFQGRTARLECGPLRSLLLVRPDGELADPPRDSIPDAVLRFTPGQLLRLLAHDAAVLSEIEIEGDTAFAATLTGLWRDVEWDVEEDLSVVFGDIAAHRMADAGRRTLAWGRYAARSATQTFAEYWTEERPLVARGRDITAFNADVARLRDEAARLEQRVQNLAARRGTGAGTGSQ